MSKIRISNTSLCPLTHVVDMIGDKWCFLIIRDMIFHCAHTYSQFMDTDEGIATNILASRLKQLRQHEIISKHRNPYNGREFFYFLTDKGLDLTPVILQMIKWSGRHDADSILSDKHKWLLENRFDESVDQLRDLYLQSKARCLRDDCQIDHSKKAERLF